MVTRNRAMAIRDIYEAIEFLKAEGDLLLRRFARSNRGVSYAELRFEVVSHRSAAATNGTPRDSTESENAAFGVAAHGLQTVPIPDPPVIRDEVDAVFRSDPRTVPIDSLKRLSLDASRAV